MIVKVIKRGVAPGKLIRIGDKIYDVKKLKDSENPDCRYTGEVTIYDEVFCIKSKKSKLNLTYTHPLYGTRTISECR